MALDPLHSGFPLPSERTSTPVNQICKEADFASVVKDGPEQVQRPVARQVVRHLE